MVSLSEQTKDTAGDLLSILNSKTTGSDVGPNSSTYDLLMAIFKVMVKREEFKLKYDDLDDDQNDQRHFNREKRHNEILEALGVKPGVKIPKKEEERVDSKRLDFKKFLKKQKLKESDVKMPKKQSSDAGGFSLASIAGTGLKMTGIGLIGAGAVLGGKGALAALVGKGESFGGDPTAYNVKSGQTYTPRKGAGPTGKPITELTVGEIRNLQNQGKLFAVGKWQMIPQTLQSAIDAGKVNLSDSFNEQVQDKLFDFLISKQPIARRYLNGDPSVTRDEAITALAKEWAAFGVPQDMQGAKGSIKKGDSYYSGVAGNRASIPPELIGEALDRDRDAILAEKLNNFGTVDSVSMNLEQTSRDNIQTNEMLTASAQQSNIINNYNVGVKEQSQQRESKNQDDRPLFERKSFTK